MISLCLLILIEGETALHVACRTKNIKKLKTLLQAPGNTAIYNLPFNQGLYLLLNSLTVHHDTFY